MVYTKRGDVGIIIDPIPHGTGLWYNYVTEYTNTSHKSGKIFFELAMDFDIKFSLS